MRAMTGRQIGLRPIIREDLERLNRWKNREPVYRYLGGGFQPVSIDIQETWLTKLMDTTGDSKRYIIETLEGTAIGMIGLYHINWIHRTCELGLLIGEEQEQGKGFGEEACGLIEQFAKRYLNLRKIKVYVISDNERAVRMYRKSGYTEAGRLKEERFIDGQYHDLLIMEKQLKIEGGGGFPSEKYLL